MHGILIAKASNLTVDIALFGGGVADNRCREGEEEEMMAREGEEGEERYELMIDGGYVGVMLMCGDTDE